MVAGAALRDDRPIQPRPPRAIECNTDQASTRPEGPALRRDVHVCEYRRAAPGGLPSIGRHGERERCARKRSAAECVGCAICCRSDQTAQAGSRPSSAWRTLESGTGSSSHEPGPGGSKRSSADFAPNGGTLEEAVAEKRIEALCLGDEALEDLGRLALRCEQVYGPPPPGHRRGIAYEQGAVAFEEEVDSEEAS
jgi:hypothetical protein